MPGIPKSDRCKYCKQRKIKCDENWPQCGNCRRSNKICSGPPTERKFVQATFGSSESRTCSSSTAESRPRESSLPTRTRTTTTTIPGTLVGLKSKTTPEGTGTFHQMRLQRAPSPSCLHFGPSAPLPTTTAGRAARRLVSALVIPGDDRYGMSLSRRTLALLPARIEGSRALQHAVECLVVSHANLRRRCSRKGASSQPPSTCGGKGGSGAGIRAAAATSCDEDLLDLKTYGRALRSVQAALADPEQMYDAATLAAVSILQRVEVPFCVCVENYLCCMCVDCGLSLQNSYGGDGVSGSLRAGKKAHTEGIYTLMERRGPAALTADELELHLALDNLGQIMTWSIIARKPNMYTLPDWSDAIMSALEAGAVSNPVLSASYRMVLQLAQWPVLVHDLDRILQDPLHPDATMAAMKLAEDASALNVTMLEHMRLGGPSSENEKETGSCPGLAETPCPPDESPFGARYDCPDLTTAQCHCYTALVLIAVNRILASALRFLGSDDPLLEVQNRELSRRIWLMLPYVRQFKPLGCVFFVTPLVVSYESAVGEEEKRRVIAALYDLEEYKGKAAAPERWTEENILRVCMALTGRMPLDQATDLGADFRSDGAR